jgi:hypothetical protein
MEWKTSNMQQIIEEIQKIIRNFNLRRLQEVSKITIQNDNGKKSILMEFQYQEKNGSQYQIGLQFLNYLRKDDNSGDNSPDIDDLFNIERLNFTDVYEYQWENIKWIVANLDEDGFTLFEFYCEEIRVEFIRQTNS